MFLCRVLPPPVGEVPDSAFKSHVLVIVGPGPARGSAQCRGNSAFYGENIAPLGVSCLCRGYGFLTGCGHKIRVIYEVDGINKHAGSGLRGPWWIPCPGRTRSILYNLFPEARLQTGRWSLPMLSPASPGRTCSNREQPHLSRSTSKSRGEIRSSCVTSLLL